MDDCLEGKERNEVVKSHNEDIQVITIDQGNSSFKGVLWNGLAPVKTVRSFEPDIERLIPLFEDGNVDGCVYCSVGHTDAKFLESLRRLVDGRLLILTHSTPLPLHVEYGSRETLGNDRVAAAAGVVSMFPGCGVLAVDAGTAVTEDVISPEGKFLGGNISPGVRLRFESLHSSTSKLPLVNSDGPLPLFGFDTATAIRAGVLGGLGSEIECAFRMAQEKYGVTRIVLTGNDAPVLAPLLRERELEVIEEPNLVGSGLLKIYNYNLTTLNDINDLHSKVSQ